MRFVVNRKTILKSVGTDEPEWTIREIMYGKRRRETIRMVENYKISYSIYKRKRKKIIWFLT